MGKEAFVIFPGPDPSTIPELSEANRQLVYDFLHNSRTAVLTLKSLEPGNLRESTFSIVQPYGSDQCLMTLNEEFDGLKISQTTPMGNRESIQISIQNSKGLTELLLTKKLDEELTHNVPNVMIDGVNYLITQLS